MTDFECQGVRNPVLSTHRSTTPTGPSRPVAIKLHYRPFTSTKQPEKTLYHCTNHHRNPLYQPPLCQTPQQSTTETALRASTWTATRNSGYRTPQGYQRLSISRLLGVSFTLYRRRFSTRLTARLSRSTYPKAQGASQSISHSGSKGSTKSWFAGSLCSYTMYHLPSTIYYIPYTIYYILYSIYYILYTIYHILYTIYHILYTIYTSYYILCTICYIPH